MVLNVAVTYENPCEASDQCIARSECMYADESIKQYKIFKRKNEEEKAKEIIQELRDRICDKETRFMCCPIQLPETREGSCLSLEWVDDISKHLLKNENSKGQVELLINVNRAMFKCFYDDEWVDNLSTKFSSEEITRQNINVEVCQRLEPFNSTTSQTIITTTAITALRNTITTVKQKQPTTAQTQATTMTQTQAAMMTQTQAKTTTEIPVILTRTLLLDRWREYNINLTVIDPKTRSSVIKTFSYNTYQWDCGDENETHIVQDQFCNNVPDCPNKRDEDPAVCTVSQLPKSLGYLTYLFMIGIIAVYFGNRKFAKNEYIKTFANSISFSMTSFLDCSSFDNKDAFIQHYTSIHESDKMQEFCQKVKYWFYSNNDFENQRNVFRWIREIEEKLHKTSENVYACILKNYKGDSCVVERICCPDGTAIERMKIACSKDFSNKIQWHLVNISFGFFLLCLHIFDYIKDIGRVKQN